MSNVQCPILILNKKVFKTSVETVFQRAPAFSVVQTVHNKEDDDDRGKTTLALDVQATTQGPHSSHTNSICCNN